MIVKLFSLSLVISLINLLERNLKGKFKYLLHPIIVAPLGGLLLGNLSAGVNIGLLLELIWGSNLFNNSFGLKYVNTVAILATVLTLITNNISLFINLTLALIISYLLQEIINNLKSDVNQWLIEVGIFIFILTLMNFVPILRNLLGIIPAQFLDKLARAGGLLPSLGLGAILAQIIIPHETRGKDKLTYFLALLITLLLSQYITTWVPIVFLVIWISSYLLSNKRVYERYTLRLIISTLIIAIVPFITEVTGPLVNTQLKLVLWSEMFLSFSTLLLSIFSITQFELYFLILIIGVMLGKAGLIL
ncbi:hypothetical protein [Selenihalanaerobacter shriftii]|uniref:PTS system, mannose-specific IIC component n=1 Tax=Selenihalanaerobacter shriftii TaxID=142842 RepID=A0A1T4KHN9_9FIRM|nr:hypothetical protein [Selenihalanaerobacter shriftii]SJZ41895.1 PTS system, mannose-specific IIC component [Selenihalanaerobacter shriftii]